jgi:hypothetical protein
MGKQIKFSWLQISVKLTLNDLQKYSDDIEAHLIQRKDELVKDYDAQSSGMSQEEKDELYEYMFHDENHSITKTYPNLLRKTHVISVYSFIEQELLNICNVIERYNSIALKLEDVEKKHKGIFRAMIYLKQTLGLKVFSQNIWTKILDINKVRNHIIHEGKTSVTSNSAVYRSMKKYKSIKLTPIFKNEKTKTQYIQFELSKEYNDEVIRDTEDFFMAMLTELSGLKKVNLL